MLKNEEGIIILLVEVSYLGSKLACVELKMILIWIL